MTREGERIIGIFKYGAIATPVRPARDVQVRQLVFTESSFFTMNAELQQPSDPAMGLGMWEWETIRQMPPEVERSQPFVTKEMLKIGNISMRYTKVKKIEIFEDETTRRYGAVDIAFMAGLFSGFDFWVPKAAVETVKSLIKETPLSQMIPISETIS